MLTMIVMIMVILTVIVMVMVTLVIIVSAPRPRPAAGSFAHIGPGPAPSFAQHRRPGIPCSMAYQTLECVFQACARWYEAQQPPVPPQEWGRHEGE